MNKLLVLLSLSLLISACGPLSLDTLFPNATTDAANSPLNNPLKRYTISGAADSNRSFIVDDVLLVSIDGREKTRVRSQNDRSPVAPITFRANIGSRLKLEVVNIGFGSSCKVDDLYLRDEAGNSQRILEADAKGICSDAVVFASEDIILE